ncbi:MAG: HAMP domain-containing sensor histidine kinase, partial [Actinocatenispora sp.]
MSAAAVLQRVDRRVPLWLRLVTGVLLLVTATLLVTGYAGSSLLRRHLIDKTGDELRLAAPRAQRALIINGRADPPPEHGVPSSFGVYLIGPDGSVLERSDPSFTADRPVLPDFADGLRRLPVLRPFTVNGTGRADWLVLIRPVHTPRGGYLLVGESLDEVDSTVRQLALINAGAGLAALGALAVACFWLVRLSLRPVHAIQTTAQHIAAGDLSQRVPDRGTRTEIGQLGNAVNGMLTRIATALSDRAASEAAARRSETQMRRFAADASHELRTPITTIRGYAELYRQQRAAMSDEDADRIVGRIEDQARRMGGLVDDLLLLAHLDQQRPLRRDRVDLTSLVADVVLDIETLVTDHPVELVALETVGEAGPIVVTGDAERLRQVVSNLISNAVRHTPAGTAIAVGVGVTRRAGDPAAVLEVRDEGPGMTAEQAAHAFERFYRADPARARSGGGAGLGLAIVGAIVG